MTFPRKLQRLTVTLINRHQLFKRKPTQSITVDQHGINFLARIGIKAKTNANLVVPANRNMNENPCAAPHGFATLEYFHIT
jgi:hypothetical protein